MTSLDPFAACSRIVRVHLALRRLRQADEERVAELLYPRTGQVENVIPLRKTAPVPSEIRPERPSHQED